jgi:hypothetical protein
MTAVTPPCRRRPGRPPIDTDERDPSVPVTVRAGLLAPQHERKFNLDISLFVSVLSD